MINLFIFDFSRLYKATNCSIHNPNTLGHHPVLTFHCDPYIQADSTSSLPDVVTNGVLLGIYKSWYFQCIKDNLQGY